MNNPVATNRTIRRAIKIGASRLGHLRCENQSNPLGIDVQHPRLSWRIESEARGVHQVAYHVLVASSLELLSEGKGDLWDSAKVQSDQSLHVEYTGKPLLSSQQAFWTVRIWESVHSEPTEWTAPATWTMGVLEPESWKAKWIGFEIDPKKNLIEQANWIWDANPLTKDDSSEPIPVCGLMPRPVPTRRRMFVKEFDLQKNRKIESAILQVGGNDTCTRINGTFIGTTPIWSWAGEFEVGHVLKPGRNRIEIDASNILDRCTAAGLMASLAVRFSDGADLEIVTDKTWVVFSENGSSHESARVIGQWGSGPWGRIQPAPHLLPIARRSFSVSKPIRRAVVHVAGLGHYRLYVNGRPAHDTMLDPPWSKYEKTIFYNTFDVTSLLRKGENALGMMLGKGYYSTWGDRRIFTGAYDRPLCTILQARIEFEDGTHQTLCTDESWKWRAGPYLHNAIIGGCDYDARKLPPGWASPRCEDQGWHTAREIEPQLGKLIAAQSPPLRTFNLLHPRNIDEPEPGKYIYDFGQNASAIVRLRVKGRPGQSFRLVYAEQRLGATPHRNDGTGLVDQSGIGSPNYIQYTCRGGEEETWQSELFYTGFQYIQLEDAVPAGRPNPEGKPEVQELCSVHLHADAPAVGKFTCSDKSYQKIDRMIDWAIRSNLSHVITDCPQREKLGYLEVLHLMWPSIAMLYDLSVFGPKTCLDMRDTRDASGMVPTVAPSITPTGFQWGDIENPFTYTPEWGAAGALVPWYLYQWYGDKRALGQNYEMMKGFVDFMQSTCAEGLLPRHGLGDWYDFGHGKTLGPSQFTPAELTAMAIFHDCTRRVAAAAEVSNNSVDAIRYQQLARKIAVEFNQRFYDSATAEYKNHGSCQTANAMALVCGLSDPSQASRIAEAIVADLKRRSYQQTSGDVGFHYLVRALADHGCSDAIFKMLARQDLGSYNFLANNGWSSLPEAWDADHNSSMNHCMLGHIHEFFAQDLCGIHPDPIVPGFKQFHVRPVASREIQSAGYTFESPYGPIISSWRIRENTFHLNLDVPSNTQALLHLPTESIDSVRESGKKIAGHPHVVPVTSTGNEITLRVSPGQYRFRCPTKN